MTIYLISFVCFLFPLLSFAQNDADLSGQEGKHKGDGWLYCGMVEKDTIAPSRSMDPANNKWKLSYSLSGTIQRFKDQGLTKMQHSYRWMGERVQCMDYIWFNNNAQSVNIFNTITLNPNPRNHRGGQDYDENNRLWDTHVANLKKQGIDIVSMKKDGRLFFANGENKSELECFSTFIDFARDPKNYDVTNNPHFEKGRVIFEELKKKKDRYGNLVFPSDLTIDQFLNGNGKGFRGFNQVIVGNQIRNFTETEIWYLQSAVNILGCDHIMQDGKLGNYTIKSMCRCAFPPQGCIELEEQKFGQLQPKTIGELGPESIFDSLKAINFKTICGSTPQCGDDGKITCTTQVVLTMRGVQKPVNTQVEFCCPSGTRSHIYPDKKIYTDASLEERVTCCIDPNKDLSKCVEEKKLLEDKNIPCGIKNAMPQTCTLKDSIPQGGTIDQGTKIPFCPCPNGNDRVLKDDGQGKTSRGCPCIPYDPEKLREKCSNRGSGSCAPEGKCVDKVTGVTEPICPCPTGQGPVKGPDGTPICACSNSNEILGPDGQCKACPEGLIPNSTKTRCECKDGCCGIKLNTNVPWIGRCIEFGNTNNLNDQFLNEYGDGNTIITVNILNAFPVLMTALGKILLTVILIFGFGLIVYAGMRWTTDGLDQGAASSAKNIIKKVAIGFACLGASAILLHFINPNFFR